MAETKKRKLHKSLLSGIETALTEIFFDGRKSDQVVPGILKSNPKWGSRDRSFVAENTYEIVRNKRLILHVLEIGSFLTSEDLRKAIGAWLIIKGYFDEENSFFEGLESEQILDRVNVENEAIKYSVPDELNAYIIGELGKEKWYTELEAMSRPADVFLRVNTSKISKEKLQEKLKGKEILSEVVPEVDSALRLLKRANVTGTDEFQKGYFEVQDAGSQLISAFVNAQPGEFIVDACAGAGGKTLHLADSMKNKGRIIAMDVEDFKLKELEKRAGRNQIRIISTQLINIENLKELKGKADKLLMDVPCSGLGVIRRNPDAKEALTAGFIDDVKKTQQKIIQDYSAMLKPGGQMVYATCSILPSENRNQIDEFLEKNTDFSLVRDQQIWPSESGFDGFYMALLIKK